VTPMPKGNKKTPTPTPTPVLTPTATPVPRRSPGGTCRRALRRLALG
jgi:hypothetical protein